MKLSTLKTLLANLITNKQKAITGGVVGSTLLTLGHFGFQPDGATITALGVVATSVIGYIIGHVAVYLKANK